jgi:hypothetical protein
MIYTSPIDKLEALERVPAALVEWSIIPKLAKDAIAFHRGHVTETARILNSVERLQKAFAEIYSSQSSMNKEWFEGTFPRFRSALDELVLYIKKHEPH